MKQFNDQPTKAAIFRRLIEGNEAVVMPAAYDALSATVIDKAGFKAVFASGAGISASLLGKPDVGLLTMSEMVDQCKRMANAVNIPVFADAEAGYGNAMNVMRTVREFEQAGVAGLFIEDQEHPVRCGSLEGKRLVSVQEMVSKIKAAKDARRDRDFVIAARTDGSIISDEETIKRAHAYIEAGADLIIPHVKGFLECKYQIELYGREIKGAPLVFQIAAVGTHGREMTTFDIARLGYKLIICTGMQYALPKVGFKLLEQLRTAGTQAAYLEELGIKAPGYDEFYGLLGLDNYKALEKKYIYDEIRGGLRLSGC